MPIADNSRGRAAAEIYDTRSDQMNSDGRRFGLRAQSGRGAAVVLAVMVSLVCVDGWSVAGLSAGRGSAFTETRGDVDRLYRCPGIPDRTRSGDAIECCRRT